VTVVLQVPETLDERGFESLVTGWAGAEGGHLLLDARHVRWVSPYGIVGLLAAGTAWQKRWGERPILQAPEHNDVASYLARIGFYELAREVFDSGDLTRRRGAGESDALLEITAITSHQDVHDVVARVRRILGQKRVGHAGTLDPGSPQRIERVQETRAPPIKHVIIREHTTVYTSGRQTRDVIRAHSVADALLCAVLALGDTGLEINESEIGCAASKLFQRITPYVRRVDRFDYVTVRLFGKL
jgi:hypothetical protein